MKKTVLVLAAVAALGIAGCKNNADTGANNAADMSATENAANADAGAAANSADAANAAAATTAADANMASNSAMMASNAADTATGNTTH